MMTAELSSCLCRQLCPRKEHKENKQVKQVRKFVSRTH
jgi:hypothetical protein